MILLLIFFYFSILFGSTIEGTSSTTVPVTDKPLENNPINVLKRFLDDPNNPLVTVLLSKKAQFLIPFNTKRIYDEVINALGLNPSLYKFKDDDFITLIQGVLPDKEELANLIQDEKDLLARKSSTFERTFLDEQKDALLIKKAPFIETKNKLMKKKFPMNIHKLIVKWKIFMDQKYFNSVPNLKRARESIMSLDNHLYVLFNLKSNSNDLFHPYMLVDCNDKGKISFDSLSNEFLYDWENLFPKFKSVMEEFYVRGKSCSDIINQFFKDQLSIDPLFMALIQEQTLDKEKNINKCLIDPSFSHSNYKDYMNGKKFELGELESNLKKSLLSSQLLVRNPFLLDGDDLKFVISKAYKIIFNSANSLYFILDLMNGNKLLTKKNIESLLVNVDGDWNLEGFSSTLKDGKDVNIKIYNYLKKEFEL